MVIVFYEHYSNIFLNQNALPFCLQYHTDGLSNYSMQRLSEYDPNLGDWHLKSVPINHAETTRDQTDDESPSPHSPRASTTPPSHSGSSIPCSFQSQSFVRNENAGRGTRCSITEILLSLTRWPARGMSLVSRIIDKLHLFQSHLPGHVKGEVDQIIHSR